MTQELKRAYIARIHLRYNKATRKEKTLILDEFCQVFKLTRKHAIKLINDLPIPAGTRPGPKQIYGPEVAHHLSILWRQMNQMCAKKMVAAMPLWLPFYDCPKTTKNLLQEISSSTIDRLLKPYREGKVRGISSTMAAESMIKNKIPIKLLDEDVKEPGFIEADTVAHCGNSLAGEFANSLTMTDLFSGWTENRATWTKEKREIRKAIADVERSLPFKIKGFASDNGNEFFNHELFDFFNDRKEKVEVVRRRPYKKNDNAHVEQKNWTHVREIFGYDRFDHTELVLQMNEIYRHYWNPLWNFFTPVMKLKEKTRVGGKLIKKHDDPKTPYQRLMESEHISDQEKTVLRSRFERMNPFELKKEMESRLKWFFKIVDIHKARNLQVG
ncbi:MAG: integrase [Bdellovibrio sp.]